MKVTIYDLQTLTKTKTEHNNRKIDLCDLLEYVAKYNKGQYIIRERNRHIFVYIHKPGECYFIDNFDYVLCISALTQFMNDMYYRELMPIDVSIKKLIHTKHISEHQIWDNMRQLKAFIDGFIKLINDYGSNL